METPLILCHIPSPDNRPLGPFPQPFFSGHFSITEIMSLIRKYHNSLI